MFSPFGRRFAWGFNGYDAQEETHQHHHGHHGHHEHRGQREGWGNVWNRRGPFRGGPFGPFGPFGPQGSEQTGGEGKRFFGKGDLKFALLELLQERPMHGYELIKALEQRSGGFYSPSPGSIYPTLQLLEDRDFLVSQETNGKKVYTLTDAGKQALEERKREEQDSSVHPLWQRLRSRANQWNQPELHELRRELGEVTQLFAMAGRAAISDPEKLQRFRAFIERSRKELADLITSKEDASPAPHTEEKKSEGEPEA